MSYISNRASAAATSWRAQARDRVSGRNGGMDCACRDDIGGIEQLRRFEELTRVDETLARLLHVARLAVALGPTHR